MLPTCTSTSYVQKDKTDEQHLQHLLLIRDRFEGRVQERNRIVQTEAAKGVPTSSKLAHATTRNAQGEFAPTSTEYLMPGEYVCPKCRNWVEVLLPVLSAGCRPCKTSLAPVDFGPLFVAAPEEA